MDDPQRFEELVTRYQGVVCAVAYAVLRDRARSEEVAQEAFLIAWQKLPATSPPPVMPGWVCGIARNLAANARRRRKETAMDHVSEPAAHGTPLDHVLDSEREQLASRALAELAQDDREAIVLYYRGDASIADVASTLGITEVAARKRVQRGRDRLKSALAAVETTLRSTRPTPAFTAACIAGLATYGARDASAATAKAKPIVPIIAGGAIVALAIGAGVMIARDTSPPSVPEAMPESSPNVAFANDRGAGSATRDAIAIVKKVDAARRTTLADKIRGARFTQGAPQVPATASGKTKVYDFSGSAIDDATPIDPPMSGSTLNKRGLRYAIRQLQPMLHECYQVAATRVGRGTLEVTMTLVGEPDVGTIVDDVELGGDGARDKDFAECMRETLLSIELPPLPAAGETWQVHYPFALR